MVDETGFPRLFSRGGGDTLEKSTHTLFAFIFYEIHFILKKKMKIIPTINKGKLNLGYFLFT